MGDCQRRTGNRRDDHEDGRRPRHRPDFVHAPHADSAGRTIRKSCTTGSRSSARNCWSKPFRIMSPGKFHRSRSRPKARLTRRKSKKKTARLTGIGRRKKSGTGCAPSRRGRAHSHFCNGKLLKIWKASPAEEACYEGISIHNSGIATGTILSANADGILVLCGKDALMIFELQREGGKRMSTAEFLAGFPLTANAKFL